MWRTLQRAAADFSPPSAILLLLATLPAASQLSQNTPELIRVNPHVYCATGYALGNVIFILTDRSVVVVDTTEGQAPARAAFRDYASSWRSHPRRQGLRGA
jgi:alkyl sulfatase BDS1-like metallo-beta-lactamase superfamily hydrolase